MPDDDIDMSGDVSTPTPSGPSQPQPSEKAKGKQKRISPPASPPGDSRRKRAQPPPISQPRKPKKPSDWHLKRKELLPNAEATKVYMFFMVIMFSLLIHL